MALRTTLLTIAAAQVLLACGGTNEGWGTQTLYVSARLGTDGSTDGTSARVEVRTGSASGAVVTDAEVTLRGAKLAKTTLTFRDQGQGGGRYELNNFAWDSNFVLEVKRGADELVGALDPPGASVITSPIAGTTFRRADNVPLRVEWKDELGRRAQTTSLRLEKAKLQESFADRSEPMRFDFEINRLVADKERVELERSNEVKLAGGVAGSSLRATSTHRIEFTVE